MTPDDLAAVRTECGRAGYISNGKVIALADALEAAWAERDAPKPKRAYQIVPREPDHDDYLRAMRDSLRKSDEIRELRDRAERAEATIRGMAADALSREAQYDEMYERAKRAEAEALKWKREYEWQCGATDRMEACAEERTIRAEQVENELDDAIGRLQEAEAALDRVRALCDGEWTIHDYAGEPIPVLRAESLRAAIEGDDQ